VIVDFQHHFTPRELFTEDPGRGRVLQYDETGAPSYTTHALLYDLDEHVRMMDDAGIDTAFLSSGAGMCAPLERARFINDRAKEVERRYPGRFIGAAHVRPLGGRDALRELARCALDLGFPGVVITSEVDGLFLDAPEFDPFWAEAARRGSQEIRTRAAVRGFVDDVRALGKDGERILSGNVGLLLRS
jgi:predicted TIM-barrel fold metal-dependent hydrolase